ncbi:MAG: ABC transporter permease [Acidimicrobiia bacterium]
MTTTSLPRTTTARRSPDTSLRAELRTGIMVARRELIRFTRTRTRLLSGVIQPVLFLFVLGYGISPLIGTTAGFDFKKFVFPGVVAMSVVSTAMFSAISIVWDREFGFLREMLVAPVSRTALVLGKTAGGATVAAAQGTLMLALAPLIGVHLTVILVFQVIGIELLMAVEMTALGVFVASHIQRMEGFQVVMQLLLLPMLFLSGAMFPLNNLPPWLSFLTRINPLTYAVAPLRQVVFAAQHIPPAARERFPSGLEVLGHTLSVGAELAIVIAIAAVFLVAAIRTFGTPE